MAEENPKKREIREKGLDLFRKKGYEKVTVKEIAGAAGISKNTFYYYFASKEQLIVDLFLPDPKISMETMAEVMALSDPYEQLKYLYGSLAEKYAKLGRPVLKAAMNIDFSRNSLWKDKLDEMPADLKVMKSIFDRAVSDSRIRPDLSSQEFGGLCIIQLIGLMQIWATSSRSFDLKKAALKQFDLLVRKQN